MERKNNARNLDKEDRRTTAMSPEKTDNISVLIYNPFVKKIYQEAEITHLMHPSFAPELDIVHVPQRSVFGEIGHIGLHGSKKSIGIIVCDKKEMNIKQQGAERNPRIAQEIRDGHEISFLTPGDIPKWVKFYDELSQRGVRTDTKIGRKMLTHSGLGRISPEVAQRIESSFYSLISRKWKDLQQSGVCGLGSEPELGLDVCFWDEKQQILSIKLFYTRTGKVKSGLLEEKVKLGGTDSPGVIIRRKHESKREAYARAKRAEKRVSQILEKKCTIPVVSTGQLSLWNKNDFCIPLEPEVVRLEEGETSLHPDDVIKFLYLGESNLKPGEIAEYTSLPSKNDAVEGLDIAFTTRGMDGTRRWTTLDDLISLDLREYKKEQFATTVLHKVGGIVIIPSNWSANQIKEHTKGIKVRFNRVTSGADVNILYLTQELFDEWQKRESVFAKTEDRPQKLTRKVEYGGSLNAEKKELVICRRHPEIGGAKMYIREREANRVVNIVMDWGASFTEKEGLSGPTAQPPSANAMSRMLEEGQLPMVPGIYEEVYLIKSILARPEVYLHKKGQPITPTGKYLLSEWYERGFKVPEHRRPILAKKIHAEFYQHREHATAAVIPSHPHADHIGMMPYLTSDAKTVIPTAMMPYIRTLDVTSNTWRGRMESISDILKPPRGSRGYEKKYREVVPIYRNGQTVDITRNTTHAPYFVDHSIFATMESFDHGNVVYTGDLRMGLKTRNAIESLSGKPNIIITESTNPVNTKGKASAGKTEKTVQKTTRQIIDRSDGKPVVSLSDPKNLTRTLAIVNSALEAGRKIALHPLHLEYVLQYLTDQNLYRGVADGFDLHFPKEIGLFWNERASAPAYRSRLKNLYESKSNGNGGVYFLDIGEFYRNPGDWTVLLPASLKLEDDLNLVSPVVIHNTWYPYSSFNKAIVKINADWAKRHGGHYVADFNPWRRFAIERTYFKNTDRNEFAVHATGHGTFEEIKEIIFTLLGGVYKEKEIVLTHGQHPAAYAAALKSALGLDQPDELKITHKLDRYYPDDPINKPGHVIRIG